MIIVRAILLALCAVWMHGCGCAEPANADRDRGSRRSAGYVAGGLPDAAAPDAAESSTITGYVVEFRPSYGQSNDIATHTAAAVSTTLGGPTAAPYYNLRVKLATPSTIENAVAPASANSEFHYLGSANQLSSWELSSSRSYRRSVSGAFGVGGKSYAELENGTANWTAFIAAIASMKTACEGVYSGAYSCRLARVLPWLQGENDQVIGTTRAQYVSDLRDLYNDYCSVAQGTYGLGACPKILAVVLGSATTGLVGSYYGDWSEITAAYYEACRDYPDEIVCAHPGYASTFQSDNHYSPAGHRNNGIHLAKAIQQLDLQGKATFDALMPTVSTLACSSNTVTIPISGGYGSGIGADTTTVLQHPFYGFRYVDDQDDIPAITSATVSRASKTVTLTLDRNCGSGARVQYALVGEPTCSSGPATYCSAAGNVRSANCEANYLGGSLCQWLIPFDQAVTTVTGSPSSAWTHRNANALIGGNPGWASARSSTVTEGAGAMSLGFRVRINSGFTSGRTLAERWTPLRHFSVRESGTSGALQISLSSDGTSTAWSGTTNSGVLSAGTAANLLVVKDGTTVSLYKNGTLVASSSGSGTGTWASVTGSIPSNLSSAGYSPWVFIGSAINTNPAGTNARMSHVAVWSRALNSIDAAAFAPSTSDPRTSVGSQLEHYWPCDGSGADVGFGPRANWYPYGTALTWLGSGI